MTTVKTSYPSEWPQLQFQATQECSTIDGQFLLSAVRTSPDDLAAMNGLDEVVFGRVLNSHSADASANLNVNFSNGATLALPNNWPLPNTGYLKLQAKAQCVDGWTEIRSQWSDASEGTSQWHESVSKLRMLGDGNLLVHARIIRTSRSLLVVYWGDDIERWHIFKKVQ